MGTASIVLREERNNARVPAQRNEEMLFRRVNNAYIRRLAFDFHPANLRFLHYLRANAGGLQCQIQTLRISGSSADIDYALVDFLGANLKPQVYEGVASRWGYDLRDDYVMLFTCNALRRNVKRLAYDVSKDSPARMVE